MPGIVKVKIVAGRDLPVMDRASDLTDAFAEVRLGNMTYKTEVCRKSLHPHWNSEWFRFEEDDEDLQDEPLQIKILDYDVYSAHDSIGKVTISLVPLLLDGVIKEINGWFPIYDTLHGIRGYVHVKVKVDFFVDTNKYRQTSCEVRFFSTSGVPSGYKAVAVQGFVDVLVVNDDPEYQWIDKIRTSRASNETRLRLFAKLSGELQRKVGLKVSESNGNAVIGYQQCFDLEGETGIVVRGIGTAVTLAKINEYNSLSQDNNSPDATQTIFPCIQENTLLQSPVEIPISVSPSGKLIAQVYRKHRSISSSSEAGEISHDKAVIAGNESPEQQLCNGSFEKNTGSWEKNSQFKIHLSIIHTKKIIDEMEFPFFTFTNPPVGFIVHLGGVVSSKSVKLLDKINNPDEPETREAWWNEIRTEIRSHAKALGCLAVVGYSEWTTMCDDLIVLSASGTAAIVRLPEPLTPDVPQTPQGVDHEANTKDKDCVFVDEEENDREVKSKVDHVQDKCTSFTDGFDCSTCHVPYHDVDLPISMTITRCMLCRHGKVPDVIFATIEPPEDLPTTGTGCFLQARVCRTKKREKGEAHAENVSQILPFMEYELHQQVMNKLKVKGMNAVFGLKAQLTVGEQLIIGVMTATAVYITALPAPPIFLVTTGKNGRSEDDRKLMELQKKMIDVTITAKNKQSLQPGDQMDFPSTAAPPNTPIYQTICSASRENEDNGDEVDMRGELDLATGVKEAYILELEDKKGENNVSMVLDTQLAEGLHFFNTQSTPGLHNFHSNPQFLTIFHRQKLNEDDLKSSQTLTNICNDIIKSLSFKVRNLKPCCLTKLTFDVEIPEDENLQISVTGSVMRMPEERKKRRRNRTSTRSNSSRGSIEEDDMLFEMEETETNHDGSIRDQTCKRHIQTEKKVMGSFQPQVTISPMSKVPNTHIERYLGNINLFFIRESTSIKEDGGLNMFMQRFIAEVHAVLKAHVLALGGNAVLAFSLNEIILLDSPNKNQGQCLLNVSGDAAFVSKHFDELADLNHLGISITPSSNKHSTSIDSPNQADHILDFKDLNQRLTSEIIAPQRDGTKLKQSHEY